MPLSLSNASQFCNVEQFSFWDPLAEEFTTGITGRTKRIDPFISLWNKASRRTNIFFTPGVDTSEVKVIKHDLTNTVLLLSQTAEKDAWQNGDIYSEMRRAHKVMAPSGGQAQYIYMQVSGTGDDLGPVIPSDPVPIYMDIERSGAREPDETRQTVEEQSYIFCSANITPNPGDFLLFNGEYYRADEWFYDTGFLCCKAANEAPDYVDVEFLFPGDGAPTYDPITGEMTAGDLQARTVSVLVDATVIDGRPTDRNLDEAITLYIYTHHIGFSPNVGFQVTLYGRTYRVTKVESNVEQRQWKLEIRP